MSAITERVRAMLPSITIAGAHYRSFSVERLDPNHPDRRDLPGELELRSRHVKQDGGDMVFFFQARHERPDLRLNVTFEIGYHADDSAVWDEEGFTAEFERRVAVLSAYPYLRVKIHELAASVERRAPILDLVFQPEEYEVVDEQAINDDSDDEEPDVNEGSHSTEPKP